MPNSTTRPNTQQYLPPTSSRSLTAGITGTHNFEVTSYSLLEGMGTGKLVSSTTFSVAGYDWSLRFYPDGITDDARSDGYVSASLHFVGTTTTTKSVLPVRVRFILRVSKNTSSSSLLGMKTGLTHIFVRAGTDRSIIRFVKKTELQSSFSLIRFSRVEYITINCDLTVTRDSRSENVNNITVPPSNLHLHIGEIADVEFSVSGETFLAHACVLAARSPVFKAELLGPAAGSAWSIKIHDIEPATFKALLHFIYTDSIPYKSGFSED